MFQNYLIYSTTCNGQHFSFADVNHNSKQEYDDFETMPSTTSTVLHLPQVCVFGSVPYSMARLEISGYRFSNTRLNYLNHSLMKCHVLKTGEPGNEEKSISPIATTKNGTILSPDNSNIDSICLLELSLQCTCDLMVAVFQM